VQAAMSYLYTSRKRHRTEDVLQQIIAEDIETDMNEDDVEFDFYTVDTDDHASETEQSDANSEATTEYDFRDTAHELHKPPDWRVIHPSEYNADTIQVGQFTDQPIHFQQTQIL